MIQGETTKGAGCGTMAGSMSNTVVRERLAQQSVVHWSSLDESHDPRDSHAGGWLRHNDRVHEQLLLQRL